MKKCYYFFLLSILLDIRISSGQDTLNFSTFYQGQAFLWQNLDTSLITEGILIDKLSWADSKSIYQKGMGSDSIPNILDWFLFYNSIKYGHLDTLNSLPTAENIVKNAMKTMDTLHSIPIFSMQKKFNRIRSHNDSSSFFSFNSNGCIAIDYSSPDSLFYVDSVFTFSFLTYSVSSPSIQAHFSKEFSLGIEWDSIQEIAIKVNNGSWYVCTLNTPFWLDLAEDSLNIFTIRFIDQHSDTIISKTSLLKAGNASNSRGMDCQNLIEPDFGPFDISYSNQLSHQLIGKNSITGRYARWDGCTLSTGLRPRPFLIVAGFNPRNTKTLECYTQDYAYQQHTTNFGSQLWRGTYYDSFNGAFWLDFRGPEDQLEWTIDPVTGLTLKNMENNGTQFLQHLREQGYDVWILAPNDGMDRIENNGMLVAEMIKYMYNYYESQHAWHEELIVMGVSAGAWATRYGLTLMEKEHNGFLNGPLSGLYPHHHTRLWISYEGEYYGTDTPLGFQYFVDGLASSLPSNLQSVYKIIIAISANEIIESPAGSQLSRYSKWNSNNLCLDYSNLKYICENLNPSTRGYPQWCRNVALSQGSTVGLTTQNPNYYNNGLFSAGSQMFDYLERAPNSILGTALFTCPFTSLVTYWGTNYFTQVYKAKFGFQPWLSFIPGPVILTHSFYENDNTHGWDFAPGGLQATSLLFYKNTYNLPGMSNSDTEGLNAWDRYIHESTLHSFSPTVGTFDIRTPSSNFTNEANVHANIDMEFDVMNIRNNPNGTFLKSFAKRFGYPHLKFGTNAKLFSPFEGICGVGNPTEAYTILPNHFHVDDFQPDFNEFLFKEFHLDDVFIQNRTIGNTTAYYVAQFQADGKIYAGQSVMQDHSDYWQEPVGKVEILHNKTVTMEAKEIVLGPGFEVSGGGYYWGHLVDWYSPCSENMAERIGHYTTPVPPYSIEDSNQENNTPEKEEATQSAIAFYPNPVLADAAQFQFKQAVDVSTISLIDLSGRVVLREIVNTKVYKYSFPPFDKGTYVISIQTSDNKEYHEKIILY